jgi:hypothetical protein
MPWFVTAISVYRDPESPEVTHPGVGLHPLATPLKVKDKRTFGFFDSHTEAYNAIRENRGDMHECLYNRLVLEYIEGGIHPEVWHSEWYYWDSTKRSWEPGVVPSDFAGTVNWAIG